MKNTSNPAPQIIRVVGYGLLAFAGIDLLFQLLANPFGGALQAFRFSSGLVDRTPVPLLALGVLLAFPRVMPLPIERTIMRLLSFVPFVYAGGFLLVIVAALTTGNRLIGVAEQQIATQSQAQMRQLETTVDRVKTLGPTELQSVVSNFNQQNRTTLQSAEFVSKLIQQTDTQKAQLREGTARALQSQRRAMTLELLKVLLGAVAGSGVMFLLGLTGGWARSPGAGQG
ncbi:MAG: HpsJ family protein [Verrucomicrobia bacterium]|nr:HpsJ family protein [Verrucomicrobiota bacterium]